jgi:hypothetical protein
VSLSWFYKWLDRTPTPTEQRRAQVDAAVAEAFGTARGLHGSPRLVADLREAGWAVSEKTVADSMRRQGLIARKIRRRGGLTRQDKTAPKFPDLLRRDFTASPPNSRWVGDMTETPHRGRQALPGHGPPPRRPHAGAAGRHLPRLRHRPRGLRLVIATSS